MHLSAGKRTLLETLSNGAGAIAAIAADHRVTLLKSLAAARGVDRNEISAADLAEFKGAVSRMLTPHASAILLDPEYGLTAASARRRGCGLMLAYEASGYESARPGRLPALHDEVSVRRIKDWGAAGVKISLCYTPFDDERINDIKLAFVERAGAECTAHDIPFFLEFQSYDPLHGNENTAGFARLRPGIVLKSMEEFAQPQYGVDVLIVEAPVNLHFVEGCRAFQGQKAHSRAEALRLFREASGAAAKPFVFHGAGLGNETFLEVLALAAEAGSDFCGALGGRAVWREGIPSYARSGVKAFEAWLTGDGVANLQRIDQALVAARPWADRFTG
jgi:tagatose 1,6-diphosphate aldolase